MNQRFLFRLRITIRCQSRGAEAYRVEFSSTFQQAENRQVTGFLIVQEAEFVADNRFSRVHWLAPIAVLIIFVSFPLMTFSQSTRSVETSLPDAPVVSALSQKPSGSIHGAIVDQNGNAVVGANISLTREGETQAAETVSDSSGQFQVTGLNAGTFRITVTAAGFETTERTGTISAGQSYLLPDTVLNVGASTTVVHVSMTQQELAQEQIQVEEKQRVLGVIPNFYVSYDHNAQPLTSKQKFSLAWKTNIDPVTIVVTGIAAGVEQASDTYSGYGQGTEGYAKRYGAAYADGFIGNMLGGWALPSLLRQDPRYFYKGNGTIKSRVLYAIAKSVICKGDNGHWQPDYSGILGGLAAAGISNLYYPPANRDGAGLTFENAGIGIGGAAIGNLFQEFLVRKLTPHTHDTLPNNP
jgi:hypothetical protein